MYLNIHQLYSFELPIEIDAGNKFLFISHFIPFLLLLTDNNDDFIIFIPPEGILYVYIVEEV